MTNGTKIIIVVIIVIAIAIFAGIKINSSIKNDKIDVGKNQINEMLNYFDGENSTDNLIQNTQLEDNEIQNNEVTTTLPEENQTTNEEQKNNDVVGKEEQDSNTENTEKDNEKIAIELAQKEWGISIDSYIFEAKFKNEEEYEVSVRNITDRNVVTIYNVNVRTGAVTE